MKYLFLLLITINAYGSECALYEQSHPTFLLNGAHLSTGKCSTCGSCHIGGVFLGTPKSCLVCHTGNPNVGRPFNHIPTSLIECDQCHSTKAFTPITLTSKKMHILPSLVGYRCDTCHTGTYLGPRGKPRDHPPTLGNDCGASGCHKPGVPGKGTLFTEWS